MAWNPFAESISPPDSSNNISINTNLSFTLAEPDNLIETNTTTNISLYYDPNVTNILMYDSSTGFEVGFDGPNSSMTFVPGGSIDGYDAYDFVIDFTSPLPYGTLIEYEINVQDTRFDG